MVEAEVDKLNKSGFSISVSDERAELLETGGGLFKARKFFDNSPFLVYNVDIVSDFDISAMYKSHLIKKRTRYAFSAKQTREQVLSH